MAGKRVSKYEIELEINQSDETRSNVSNIEREFKDLSEAIKGDLSSGMKEANKYVENMLGSIKDIVEAEGDSTKEIAAFNKASKKAVSDLEKQYTDITFALSAQGKAMRERLSDLEKERKTLGKRKADKQRIIEIDAEIKRIQKDVMIASDDELKSALKLNKEMRAKLKLSQSEIKAVQAQSVQSKKLSGLVKDDIKAIREKIKAQFKFIDALKTTEGRYKLIKKAAGTVAKGAGIVGAGIVGGALAVGGMAISSAGAQVEREREANRIRMNLSPDEKNALLGQLYTQTGADYTSIVDAINRVTSVLGMKKRDEVASAAIAEIKFPGAAAMFRQQNTGAATGADFGVFANRMKAIQGQTGATVQQIQEATNRIANIRQGNFANASMTDLLSIYSALQGSGAYDTQDELDRVFNAFLRAQRGANENIFDFAEKYFTTKSTQTRGVYGATNKQQAMQALSQISFAGLREAATVESSSIQMTAAEQTAKTMREFEEARMKLLQNVVKVLGPIMEKLSEFMTSSKGEKFVNSITDFFTKTIAKIVDWLDRLVSDTDEIKNRITEGTGVVETVNADGTTTQHWGSGPIRKSGWSFGGKKDWFDEHSQSVSGAYESNGGIASMPSICGERGAEMVIPLDHSRAARSANLTQNLVQNFNMSGNETTALSLSQAVKSRDFTRAMMNSTWLNGRLGR